MLFVEFSLMFRSFETKLGFPDAADSGPQPVPHPDCIKGTPGQERRGRNFENHENHGLGHVESPFWSKNRRGPCAAHNVLKTNGMWRQVFE